MLNLNNLKHKYFVIRHGHSVPNEKGLIISAHENGIQSQYGLTDKGIKQANLAAELFTLQVKNALDNAIIIHSPFSRAKQTAEAISQVFGCRLFEENDDLRERYFGDFELTTDKNYQQIWEHDKLDPDSTFQKSESPAAVQERMLKVIAECEKLDEEYGQNIFLVGHADSIHILETAFRNIEVQNHRDIPYIRNAEIRALN
jgi:glucosyl-3-phosphoglycerate phosphatase